MMSQITNQTRYDLNHKGMRVALPVFLAAILGRILIAPFTGHPYDLSIWIATGRNVANLTSPYTLHPSLGYPPLWAYWCGVAYKLSQLIMPANVFSYIFLIKLPIILGDIALAWLMMIFSPQTNSNLIRQNNHHSLSALARAELFLFNPYTVMVGVVWSMMDNIVALLVVLVVVALRRRQYAWAGILLGLSITLKLYPVLFLPVCLIYLIKKDRIEQTLRFLAGIAAVFLVVIFPFLIFRWDLGGLLIVLIAQVARSPGGVAPIGILSLLPAIGVTQIGPFSVSNIYDSILVRLLWLPGVAGCVLFLYFRGRFSKISDFFDSLLLTFAIYMLLTPWLSEQSVETLLVLMVFSGVSKGFKLREYGAYFLGSIIVLIFIVFHVPLTSFVYPVVVIDSAPFLGFGAPFLPWLAAIFGAYCLYVAGRLIRGMNRPFRAQETGG